jgi:hypothetical protein
LEYTLLGKLVGSPALEGVGGSNFEEEEEEVVEIHDNTVLLVEEAEVEAGSYSYFEGEDQMAIEVAVSSPQELKKILKV